MSPYYEDKLRESVLEKRKYWKKVLSDNAMWLNLMRVLDMEDLFSEWAWAESMFFIWLDISNLIIFGLQPYEMEPMNLDFTIELPSLEEWEQGIKLKIEPVDLGEQWAEFNLEVFGIEVPPICDFTTFLNALVWPDLSFMLWRKLVIGQTKYGEGYVDPPVIREFLRATFLENLKRRFDLGRLKQWMKLAIEKLDIAEGVAEAVYNKIVEHVAVIFENFILDFNLLNYSKLCKREPEKGVTRARAPIITWREEEHDMEYDRFAEINVGFILNVTPLNFNIMTEKGKKFYKETIVGVIPIASHFIDWKVRRLLSRYRATHVAIANYQRPEEQLHYYASERCEQIHALREIFYTIDSMVDTLLEREDVDIFRRNLYRTAARSLIGYRKKRHKWGYAAYKTMTEEEFKRWWISHWERQGLKREILERIYERLERWLPILRNEVEELGRRVREIRYRLARLLR